MAKCPLHGLVRKTGSCYNPEVGKRADGVHGFVQVFYSIHACGCHLNVRGEWLTEAQVRSRESVVS